MTAKYHHGDLRNTLIEAAISLVEERGGDQFSMREAARVAGVSSGAPYRHFEDKDELMREVAKAVAQRISDEQGQLLASASNPIEGFRAMGIANVVYAVEHPELFKLLNDKRWFNPQDEGVKAVVASHEGLMEAAIQDGGDAGLLDATHKPALIMLAGQALSYGLARMLLDGHVGTKDTTPEQAARLAEAVLDMLGTGFINPEFTQRDP